jgi:tight adherence protein B
MLTFIVLLLLLGGGGAIFFSMRGKGGSKSLSLTARLGRYGLAGPNAEKQATPVMAHGKRQQNAVSQGLDRVVGGNKIGGSIKGRLERADLKMTPGEYLGIAGVVFIVGIFAGFLLSGKWGILALLGLSAAGAVGPWIYLWRRAKKRRRKFIEQLADMAQMMGNSMRAGFSIIQSMEMVGNEGPSPAKDEFERVVTEIKLGLPVDTALEHLLQRMPSEDLELMVVAILVQRQIGGNLSEILMVISETIRERVRFERDLKALTAQARYSSYIITGLPVGVAIVINFMDHPYESYLYTAMLGHIMLGIAVSMLGLGFFFLNRIANIEV